MNPPNVPGPSNLPPNEPGSTAPPPATPPPGGTPPPYTPPPSRPAAGGGGLFSGRNIIIGLIALALICVCACAAIFLVVRQGAINIGQQIQTQIPGGADTIQVTLVATDFMTRLKNSDWTGAYNLCTPDLQKELGTAPQLGTRITSGRAQPVSWTFSQFSDITPQSADAQIDGTASFSGNRTGTLRLVLDRVGTNQWKISGFNLTPQ